MNTLTVHTIALYFVRQVVANFLFRACVSLICCLWMCFFLTNNVVAESRMDSIRLDASALLLQADMLIPPHTLSVFENDMGLKVPLTLRGWKYRAGDSLHWAANNFDDKLWNSISSTQETTNFPDILRSGIGWFRLRIVIDSSLAEKRIALKIGDVSPGQFYPIPMEIFLNGRCCFRQGMPSATASNEQIVCQGQSVETILLPPAGEYTLAVRVSFHGVLASAKRYHWLQQGSITKHLGFSLAFVSEDSGIKIREQSFGRIVQYIIAATIPCCFAFLHGVLFIFYRREKSNISLSLYALSSGVLALVMLFARGVGVSSLDMMIVSRWVLNPFLGVMMGAFILFSMFALKRERPHRLAIMNIVWTACSAIAFSLVDMYEKWSYIVSIALVI